MSNTILHVNEATMRFGGVTAVNRLDMRVREGSIVGLIGPNGAGKTTVFNIISGFYTPTEGDVLFQGNSIIDRTPHEVCKTGIARTFQNIRLFGPATALENVMVGGHVRQKNQWWMPPFFLHVAEERRMRTAFMELLERMGLADVAHMPASSLPYGAQRRLEIARALATRPAFLLLDEPAAGMNPQESSVLMDLIRSIRDDFNLTILLIEHDMKVVMGVCSHIWVLDYGQCIAEGNPDQIRSNSRVIEAYLGEEYVNYA